MDYNAVFKEKLGKLLFLEMNVQGFKESVKIPSHVDFKNKDLYIPIAPNHLTKNVENEIALKNLPIYYFIEGMFYAMGADENLRFNEDYEIILTYIKDTENCIRSVISKKIKEDKLIDAYILLKGYYSYSKDKEIMGKLLMVGETLREKDSSFKEILLEEIEYSINNSLNIKEAYLYKALILKDDNEFKSAKIFINQYKNLGGEITDEIEILMEDINNISIYEESIESINTDPVATIKGLIGLLEKFEENPLIYYYLAVAYRKLENYEKSIYYLTESMQRESGIYEVIVEMGINYACLNDFESALAYFRKAFEVKKEVEVCTNIVMCYLNLNDIEQAKLHLDIAKKLDKDDEIVNEIDRMMKNS